MSNRDTTEIQEDGKELDATPAPSLILSLCPRLLHRLLLPSSSPVSRLSEVMLLDRIGSRDSSHSNDRSEEEGCTEGKLVGLKSELFFERWEGGEIGFGVGDGGDDLCNEAEGSAEFDEEGMKVGRTDGSSKRVRSSFPKMACCREAQMATPRVPPNVRKK